MEYMKLRNRTVMYNISIKRSCRPQKVKQIDSNFEPNQEKWINVGFEKAQDCSDSDDSDNSDVIFVSNSRDHVETIDLTSQDGS